MHHNCLRCGTELNNPTTTANYVISEDFVVEEDVEVLVALKHNDNTRQVREEIKAEWNIDDRVANRAIMQNDRDILEAEDESGNLKFSHFIHETDFDEIEVDAPIQYEDDPEILKTVRRIEPRPVQKTGLVCRDCFDAERDEVIWGADKPAGE